MKGKKGFSFKAVIFFLVFSLTFSFIGPIGQVKADVKNKKIQPISEFISEKGPEIIVESTAGTPEKLSKDLVVLGFEGVENPLIRKITQNTEFFGFKDNSENLEDWIGIRAHQLAILFGFVHYKYGGEIRINNPDEVAIDIGKDADGNFICKIFVKDANGNFPDDPVEVIKAARSFDEAKFLAEEDENGNFASNVSFGYFYAPSLMEEV